MKHINLFTIAALLFAFAACDNAKTSSDSSNEAESSHQEDAHNDMNDHKEAEMDMSKPHVMFMNLKDGDVVDTTFEVQFGVMGMEVEPAGEIQPNKGHHHLIIDGKPIPENEVVPKDETHFHYGKGQTSDKVTLTEGTHTLTAQFANGMHLSYGPSMSKTITITVKAGGAAQ